MPNEQQNQKQPKPTLNRFGRQYTLQGVFTDAQVLEKTKDNWKKAGHKTIILKGGILYVSTMKTRNY